MNESTQLKIFIIEDDVYTLSSLEAKLGAHGFEVGSSRGVSPEEIVQEVMAFFPDIIILEPAASAVDGFSVLDMLKSEENISRAPIFVFTGLGDAEKERTINSGADYYFSKKNYILDDFINSFKQTIANRRRLA